MNYKLFKYLKKRGLTDPFQVNSLFVTAFIQEKGWNVERCSVIISLLGYYQEIVTDFIKVLKDNGFTFCLEDLIKLFEFVISPVDRIVTGAVYTPENIRSAIIQRCLGDKKTDEMRRLRVADISCGCGGFLMDVAFWIHHHTGKSYRDIFRENIWGIDIQDYSIGRTKILLSLLALSEGEDEDFEFNLLCRDTLDYLDEDWNSQYNGFDIIVGNPPYVCARNLSKETHSKLNDYEVCTTGHPDLYIPFFQIATEMLDEGGRLGYITMNTFLRSINGRAVRNYFSRNRYAISIVDFRGYQVFESKNTYTCLFYLDKTHKEETIKYAVDERASLYGDILFKDIPYTDLDDDKGWTLNDYDTTVSIETTGVQIKDYCPSRHGIATLSNDTYIFMPVANDDTFFYLESEGKKYPIERGICRDIVNPNKLNSINNLNLLIEKVIFPYRFDGKQAIVYTPDEMKHQYPRALAYLEANKQVLLGRDKGKTNNYPQWYAFGRTQSLIMPRFKLFFPKFANKPLRCIICDAPDLMLYNGMAFVNSDERKLKILKAVIESELFWGYVQSNAKPYSSGYYSLSGLDIRHFGIPEFSEEEEEELLAMDDKNKLEKWLRGRYRITI